jgi:WD40 repeat protein
MRKSSLAASVMLALSAALGWPVASPVAPVAAAEADELPKGAVKRLGAVERPVRGRCGAVAFLPDGKTVIGVRHTAETGHIFSWDVETGRELRVIKEPGRRTMALVQSADGKSLATASWDSTVVVWDLSAGAPLLKRGLDRYSGSSGTLLSLGVALSPSGRLLACQCFRLGQPEQIALWETASGLSRGVLLNEDGGPLVWAMAVAPDGRYLAGARYRANPGIRMGGFSPPVFWDLSTGRICREFQDLGGSACGCVCRRRARRRLSRLWGAL